jgi:hypothetical protein
MFSESDFSFQIRIIGMVLRNSEPTLRVLESFAALCEFFASFVVRFVFCPGLHNYFGKPKPQRAQRTRKENAKRNFARWWSFMLKESRKSTVPSGGTTTCPGEVLRRSLAAALFSFTV